MTLATKDEAQAVKVAVPKDMSLYETIHQTVAMVPSLRHMDRAVVRDVTDALMAAFGQDGPSMRIASDPVPFCGPDAELLQAIKDLLEWAPEAGYADGFGEFAVKTDDCRFYFLEGEGDPAEEYQNLSRDLPLLSQPITYAVVGGKHDGRGIMGRVEKLRRLAGLKDSD